MDSGTVLASRFVVERQVAAGGMGTVYRALDRLDDRRVALKVLHSREAFDVERFERESQILAELSHPGIVRYVAHGSTGTGEHYLAMEWLEGEDLSTCLARRQLTAAESLAVLRRTADALAFAHARGIIHRDVKPSNIFLVAGDVGQLKLVDFGIARPDRESRRLTYTGGILGTPGYIAPEQIESGSTHDARADVFSLACVFYECIAGRPAFEGAHVMAALAKLLFQQTPKLREIRADLPEPLEQLISRMMAKHPDDRPRDCGDVGAQLAQIADVLDAWATPRPVTLASPRDATMRSARGPGFLTRSEQRLVSLVLAGEPEDVETSVAAAGGVPSASDVSSVLQELTGEGPASAVPRSEVRAAVEPYGAHITEISRGSLVAILAGAGSAVDRAERAVRCALALRARFPGIPLAVATGRGVSSAKLIEGDVIDRGVRALRATQAGIVRLDDVTASIVGGRLKVDADEEGPFLAGETAADESTPVLLGKPSLWVGRSRELSMLEGVFSGCVSESLASAVLVLGPAGAGKSRLRLEFLTRVRRQFGPVEILSGRAESVAAGSPFGLIADAIRKTAGIREGEPVEGRRRKLKRRLGRHLSGEALDRIAAFLGELSRTPFPDGEASGLRAARDNAMLMADATRGAWEDWLAAECAAQPVLLVLEDLQWGDAATVRLIDATLRNLRDLPLMLLALARPEVNKQFPGLWADREVQTIKLGPLPSKASERLVRSALGEDTPAETVARVVERADGNPFYLEELIRAVADGKGDVLPDSVLGTVEARLDAEGHEAKRVLRAASIFGDRFSKLGVASLLGGAARMKDTETWLDALSARELIAPASTPGWLGPTDYVFRHAIVREAAYAMLTEQDRALGHKLAGEWLERSGHTDAMALAEHFRLGGQPERAVRWYRRAAEQAIEANDLASALARAEMGVQCGATDEELGRLRLVEAEASVWRQDTALAAQRGAEAASLVRPGSSTWFRAIAQVIIAEGKLGHFDRVESWAARVAEATGAPSARNMCLCEGATYLVFGGRYAAADRIIGMLDAVASGPASLDPQTAGLYQQVRAIRAQTKGDIGAALSGLTAALAAFEQAGDRRNACAVRSNLGFLYGELGDFEVAESALRMALAAAQRMGLDDLETAALQNLGYVIAHLGQLDEAKLLEQRAAAAFQQQGDRRMEGVTLTYLAKILLLSGDPAAAEREARAAVEALTVAPPLRAAAVALLSRALLAQGRAAEALPVAREAFAQLEETGSLEEGESLVRLAYAEALAAAGAERAAAEALAAAREQLLRRAEKISDPSIRERFLTCVPDNAKTLALASGST
ncbi:protein kinase [Sorangium cellulosum]|uniref:Protein kinase n=1 Tax=Sorangium cellulosum TaxID=56 RepID=A0A4P2QCA3_SORCE|nr:serine/threonine-protein kinase [Sorangium cellulosum]AUX27367.1 protein kinase [Sorangium cellulosum]